VIKDEGLNGNGRTRLCKKKGERRRNPVIVDYKKPSVFEKRERGRRLRSTKIWIEKEKRADRRNEVAY